MALTDSIRYSEAFKMKVIQEIEAGTLNLAQACARYGIGCRTSIKKWIQKYGKSHLLGKVVRVQTPDERDQLKILQAEKQELESALAKAHLKASYLEELIKVAEEEYKIDIKKNSGHGRSRE